MSQKVSISIDEELLKIIDAERGDVPRSKYIENAIRSAGSFFEALWIFSDEFDGLTKIERWGSSHASQPIGKPLHTHEGYISISDHSLRFYDSKMELLFSLERNSVRSINTSYDDVFRRFRDSRGFIPPQRIELEDKTLYLYTRPIGKKKIRGGGIFKGDNESVVIWFQNRLTI